MVFMIMRDKFIETATELFAKYGIRSISIDDICNEIHISKKTFYLYFKQKDELIKEVLHRIRSKKFKKVEQKIQTIANFNIIDEILFHNIDFVRTHQDKLRSFTYDLEKYYPDLMNEYRQTISDAYTQMCYIATKKGVKDGLFREDIDINTVSVFISAQIQKTYTFLQSNTKLQAGQIIDFLSDICVRALVNEKGLKYYLTKKKELETKEEGKKEL